MIKTKKQILINCVVFFLGSMSVCYGAEEIKDPNIRCKDWAFNQLYNQQRGQAREIQQAITDVRKIALSKPGSCKNKITNKNKLKANVGNAIQDLIANLIKKNSKTYQIFDENVASRVEFLIVRLQQNLDYCSNSFPSDEEIKKISADISDQINTVMAATNAKITPSERPYK